MTVISKKRKWENKKKRISYKIKQKLSCPRLVVFRSNKNIFVQLIDNNSNNTICSSSSVDKSLNEHISKAKSKIDMSKIVAEDLSKKLKTNKIEKVVFDRNGYRFHGRVKAIADTLKENGISV